MCSPRNPYFSGQIRPYRRYRTVGPCQFCIYYNTDAARISFQRGPAFCRGVPCPQAGALISFYDAATSSPRAMQRRWSARSAHEARRTTISRSTLCRLQSQVPPVCEVIRTYRTAELLGRPPGRPIVVQHQGIADVGVASPN